MKFEFQSHMGDEVCIVTNIPPEIISVPVEKEVLSPFTKSQLDNSCCCCPEANGQPQLLQNLKHCSEVLQSSKVNVVVCYSIKYCPLWHTRTFSGQPVLSPILTYVVTLSSLPAFPIMALVIAVWGHLQISKLYSLKCSPFPFLLSHFVIWLFQEYSAPQLHPVLLFQMPVGKQKVHLQGKATPGFAFLCDRESTAQGSHTNTACFVFLRCI